MKVTNPVYRSQALAQLPVACSTLTASNGKLGKGLGKKLVTRGVSVTRAARSVVFKRRVLQIHSTTTLLLYGRQRNGQQVADKSKEMRRCQRVVAIL